jgi:ABC-type amino acid transport substrate-binding protein
MTMRRCRLAVLALLILAPGVTLADTLVIGVEEEPYYPVYQSQGEDYTGAAPEILNLFAKASGHTLIYRHYPIPRLYRSFIDGDLDYKFPDNEKWARDAKAGVTVVYSDPVIAYIDGANVVATRKGDDLSHLRILGIPLGFTPWDYKDLIAAKTVSISENPSFDGLIQQALAGRIDAIYASVAVIAYQVKRLGQPGALVFDANLPHTRDFYRLSTIKHPEMIAQFNKWLSDTTAAVAAIKAKYGAEDGF